MINIKSDCLNLRDQYEGTAELESKLYGNP